MQLPVDAVIADIRSAIAAGGRVVVHAPPGSGKTTRVPAALLDQVADRGAVVVLEPRRIAARAAADFVARERGGKVGDEVGYQVRFERVGNAHTRLWFVTEGILTRRFGRDPFLEGVAILVLDEFHERHLHGDVALALACQLQRTVRPDLGIVVMSATLEAERIAAYLEDCPVVRVETRPHPVVVHYLSEATRRPLTERVLDSIERTLRESDTGDILVFLPGVGEIRRIAHAAMSLAAAHGLELLELHGSLPLAEQQRVLRRGSRRRVVLATNVAETALTIDGVTTVIDSGLVRTARYDARHGFNSLQIGHVSRASATQRAGRAGRTAPGTCRRLWTLADDNARRADETPEIQRLDLAEFVLQVQAWGMARIEELPWLDPPPPSSLQRARSLLQSLGALQTAGSSLTPIGERMTSIGASPRLARMLIEAERLGDGAAGALAAALASERDIRRAARLNAAPGPSTREREIRMPEQPLASAGSDLVERAELFLDAQRRGFDRAVCLRLDLDRGTLLAVDRARIAFSRALGISADPPDGAAAETLGRSALAGFPDRVVRRRAVGSARGVMVGGIGVVLDAASAAAGAELFVALEVEKGSRKLHAEARVRLASAVRPEWLKEVAGGNLRVDVEVEFDAERRAVIERCVRRYLDLPLGVKLSQPSDAAAAGEVLAAAALAQADEALSLGPPERALLARLAAARQWLETDGFPDPADVLAAVVRRLSLTRRSFAELQRVNVLPELRREVPYHLSALLDVELPESLVLPSGRTVPIRYDETSGPVAAGRVQELFGLTRTPRLARGRVSLAFEILAPNQRPVQITRDLESFWRSGYADVRKQLRGRYPKHDWPEDPSTARPTSRARPRK